LATHKNYSNYYLASLDMIRIVLLDADGVVLLPREKIFSRRLQEQHSVPAEKTEYFFKNVYPSVVIGKRDLRDALTEFAQSIGWQQSVQDLLDFWFLPENKPNAEVLAWIGNAREGGKACYLVSDQSEYRASNLLELFGGVVDGGFFSSSLGVLKDNPEFFRKIMERLNCTAAELIFIDDEKENVESAKSVGIQAVLFTGEDSLKGLLS
jgi:putative hydrolase of the HAD superfamily